MTRNGTPFSSPKSYTGRMFGCSSDATMRASRRNRSRKCSSAACVARITFTATVRASFVSVAR